MTIARGRQLAVLGDCFLGAKVAESLALKPGDSLISSPESLFDLAGVYPLKMKVAGILKKSHTSDDLAVFVDLKTAWVIQRLGHGHQDVTKLKDLWYRSPRRRRSNPHEPEASLCLFKLNR